MVLFPENDRGLLSGQLNALRSPCAVNKHDLQFCGILCICKAQLCGIIALSEGHLADVGCQHSACSIVNSGDHGAGVAFGSGHGNIHGFAVANILQNGGFTGTVGAVQSGDDRLFNSFCSIIGNNADDTEAVILAVGIGAVYLDGHGAIGFRHIDILY